MLRCEGLICEYGIAQMFYFANSLVREKALLLKTPSSVSYPLHGGTSFPLGKPRIWPSLEGGSVEDPSLEEACR